LAATVAFGGATMLITLGSVQGPPAVQDKRLIEFPCGFRQFFGVHFGVGRGHFHLLLNIMLFDWSMGRKLVQRSTLNTQHSMSETL